MSWKEAPIDAMILSLYYLQGFFKYEILRGKCGLGQFNLKDIHKNCQVDRDIVEFPNDVITPTEIIDRVKGNIQESIQQLTKLKLHVKIRRHQKKMIKNQQAQHRDLWLYRRYGTTKFIFTRLLKVLLLRGLKETSMP